MELQLTEYIRKTFPVNAVEVTLENINQVAEWCKGTIEQVSTKMMGTEALLPVIKIKGQGANRGQDFVATLGCFVVELKGSFRVYKPAQFHASFDKAPLTSDSESENYDGVVDGQEQLAKISGSPNCGPEPLEESDPTYFQKLA